mmetsp:Transcript_63965/g.75715  ORF Transcript_63965/g.75715 Transcript_63965/m.75715 type:complete len:95 (-) Transcript_63965:995-1279(-)
MERLERGKLGRLTFLPLNQLHVDNSVRYPESPDVTSLLKQCVSYDPRLDRAFRHVFGKKLFERTVDMTASSVKWTPSPYREIYVVARGHLRVDT